MSSLKTAPTIDKSNSDSSHSQLHKLTAAGLLITLGIIYGDIGTSPLYVFKSIIKDKAIDEILVLGGVSCIFWTLTIQTTFKYVILTLQADNHGEGGVFSLYSLVRKRGKWLVFPAIIGAGTLLADGIITPPISVSSAVEGLVDVFPWFSVYVIPTVLIILTGIFFFQQFGTKSVGRFFGPIMLVWFCMLGILGISQIVLMPTILRAISPHYAIILLTQYPQGFWLLGSVFLCTTGAEALYSDLGHCGKENIRISWIFVKTTLVLNYLGQAAWVLKEKNIGTRNPFYEIMPEWFLPFGIFIATVATIIASQALISGSFTLISEAIGLNFWPRVAVRNPTDFKGQIYIPSVNWLLFLGCISIQLYFQNSDNMQAAYGFFITIAMLNTTILLSQYLIYVKKWPLYLIIIILAIFFITETSFLIANISKIKSRLFFVILDAALIAMMWVWYKARKINNGLLKFVSVDSCTDKIKELANDSEIPLYATHLVYLTRADRNHQVEKKVINSIFAKVPKRAKIYWLLHIDRTNEPYTMDYDVEEISDDLVIKVNFRIGFRIQPRVAAYFKEVFDTMIRAHELQNSGDKFSPYQKYNMNPDVKFIVLERFLSIENHLSMKEAFVLNTYFFIKRFSQSDEKAFGLEATDVVFEKVPLLVHKQETTPLKRKFFLKDK